MHSFQFLCESAADEVPVKREKFVRSDSPIRQPYSGKAVIASTRLKAVGIPSVKLRMKELGLTTYSEYLRRLVLQDTGAPV